MSFSDPSYNVSQMDLQSGAKVADIGAGSGFYSFALARAVGDGGRVYAIEIQKDMAEKLKIEANKMGLQNIDIIWGDAEHSGGTRLRDDLLDGAVVANILFQIGDKVKFAEELRRILKVGARVLVVDWLESYGGMGPHSDHVVTKRKALELFESSGFKLERDIRAGAHHWGFILRKV